METEQRNSLMLIGEAALKVLMRDGLLQDFLSGTAGAAASLGRELAG
jgi:hypothetical protein